MERDVIITFAALAGALLVLMLELVSADVALMAALGLVVAAGVLPLEQALSGFANPTILALASLYVLAAALRNSGALSLATRHLLGDTTALRPVLARIVVPVSVGSAFLNNTPIVAMAIPALQSWCDKHGITPSRVLLPVSYASIFGGMCTLMGTSTNLVAHGMLQARGMDGLGFFELAAVGVPCTLVGWVYLVAVGPWALTGRQPDEPASEELADEVVEIEITDDAALAGTTVGASGLRQLPGLSLHRIDRGVAVICPVDDDETLRAGDSLLYVPGDGTAVADELDTRPALKLSVADIQTLASRPEERTSREAHTMVVREDARLVGETIAKSGILERFNAVVRQVRRGGDKVVGPVEDIVLKAGDTVVVETGPDFRAAFEDSEEFYVTSKYEAGEEDRAIPGSLRERLDMYGAIAVLLVVVAGSALGAGHIAVWALIGAILLIVTGVVPTMRARDAIDWKVLVVVGAALGLGEAMDVSGAAELVGTALVDAGRSAGTLGLLAALLVGTSALTNTITNNGAVALFFPIAIAVADSVKVDPRPMVIAITAAGSMAMVTPLGYQTNLMVYSAGDYRFGDFVRFGLPLQLLLMLVSCAVIPWVWSF